jgi:hypothetical protein
VAVSKVKVTSLKIDIQFLLNNLNLLWPIDTKLCMLWWRLGSLPRYLCWRLRSLLLKIEIPFPLNNLRLLLPINTKFGVWVAYIERQIWITTHLSVIKISVTKNRNYVFAQYLEFALAYWHQTYCVRCLYQAASRYSLPMCLKSRSMSVWQKK